MNPQRGNTGRYGRGGYGGFGRGGSGEGSRGGRGGSGWGRGRGSSGGGSAQDLQARGLPSGTPTGPRGATQGTTGGFGRGTTSRHGLRQGMQGRGVFGQGSQGRGGFGSGRASGGRGAGRGMLRAAPPPPQPQSQPQQYGKKRAPLEPGRFHPPQNCVDQTNVPKAMRDKTKCLRCGCDRKDHPHYKDCRGSCVLCGMGAHEGRACPTLWCSEKWWKETVGHVPEGIQLRPSEYQRQLLASQDAYFETFPPRIDPQWESQTPVHKRTAAEAELEADNERQKRAATETQQPEQRQHMADEGPTADSDTELYYSANESIDGKGLGS